MVPDDAVPLRAAVVGTGHLGRHHARNLGAIDGVELVGIVDPDETRGRAAAELGRTSWFPAVDALPEDLDLVSIAAPTPLHFDLAAAFLERGVACLVEKPMCATLAEAERLAALAERTGVVCQVGHIERFNPVLDHLPPLEGPPRFVDARRFAPHPGRSTDTTVVFDLMVHDLDLVLAWAGAPVRSFEARGGVVIGPLVDWAAVRLEFENGVVAHVAASRVAPSPERRTVLATDGRTITIDFGARSLSVVDPGGTTSAKGSDEEPLRRELVHFADCVRRGTRPCVSHVEGKAAVELAQRIVDRIDGRRGA